MTCGHVAHVWEDERRETLEVLTEVLHNPL